MAASEEGGEFGVLGFQSALVDRNREVGGGFGGEPHGTLGAQGLLDLGAHSSKVSVGVGR